MRVMVMVKATPGSEAGELPTEELMAAMGDYNDKLVKAGILLAGEGLHPSSRGVRVRFSGRERSVTDGPFAETKELVAGFWLWRVNSMQEAIDWVKRCPNPMMEDSDIEIRPLFEAEDFGEVFPQELREQEARIRAETQGLAAPRFEDGRERTIAGFNATYAFDARAEIPAQWQRFVAELERRYGTERRPTYGVCWNYRPGSGFDYLSGIEVTRTDDLPADFVQVSLPQQRYAIFEHRAHVSTLPQTIDAIWSKWAPDCGLRLADSPCFERYTEAFDPGKGIGGIEVWIPIAA